MSCYPVGIDVPSVGRVAVGSDPVRRSEHVRPAERPEVGTDAPARTTATTISEASDDVSLAKPWEQEAVVKLAAQLEVDVLVGMRWRLPARPPPRSMSCCKGGRASRGGDPILLWCFPAAGHTSAALRRHLATAPLSANPLNPKWTGSSDDATTTRAAKPPPSRGASYPRPSLRAARGRGGRASLGSSPD